MPLPYTTEHDLDIPADAFNADGLDVLIARGGRFRSRKDWWIEFIAQTAPPDGPDAQGDFWVDVDDQRRHALENDPAYPDLAIETAFTRLVEQGKERGWRVVMWKCLNSHYGPADAPFCCAAQVVVANAAFVPTPRFRYADEMPLDEVMGAMQEKWKQAIEDFAAKEG